MGGSPLTLLSTPFDARNGRAINQADLDAVTTVAGALRWCKGPFASKNSCPCGGDDHSCLVRRKQFKTALRKSADESVLGRILRRGDEYLKELIEIVIGQPMLIHKKVHGFKSAQKAFWLGATLCEEVEEEEEDTVLLLLSDPVGKQLLRSYAATTVAAATTIAGSGRVLLARRLLARRLLVEAPPPPPSSNLRRFVDVANRFAQPAPSGSPAVLSVTQNIIKKLKMIIIESGKK